MEKLSAVIITFNEEKNIERCIRSLEGVADEIVVLDSFSTDRTREICENLGVRFFTHAFDGYIEQKNRAILHASYPLILSLDADEALSDTLKNSILKVKEHRDADGYTMNRLTNYCGQWIRHCGWYPDRKLRLFDKNKGRWSGLNPHDYFKMQPGSVVKHLKGDLLHYSYYSIEQHKKQVEHFSTFAAKAKFEHGEKAFCIKTWGSPFFKFLSCFFLHLGFLEGKSGWQICTLSSKESYLKYKKLARLYRQRK
ncbi:glycosyltransferase family 2 protein [Candidatus Sulfidibacterium hydrothermale]|uniref:glycosyltransferase family 2 protein n=1 Tax=Candidatus Sulfidibacterium hydrothermale TaxID=2875962 RepID=UPI001F0A9350|nr:glycosyltransferase family 2 protein [Candidatus Sulfidibacterium hydrothermale]UBM62509.1 glycosyltransferase family 2 protein [Candidatus Sulfidibacterium hydrothermale]